MRNEYSRGDQLSVERFSGFDANLGYDEMIIRYSEDVRAPDISYIDRNGKSVETEVMVMKTVPGSWAETSGIRRGDILLEYNDKPVRDFIAFIRERDLEPAAGPAGTLQIRRGEKILVFSVPYGKLGIELQARAIHRPALEAATSSARDRLQ